MGTSRVTVLMPVCNGQKYLREAIDSILAQTYRDFELLIIDNGSTDSSAEIIRSYSDPRIRFVQNGQNYGLIYSLNRGLELSTADYIVRMDCDDISLPRRLEIQVRFMDENPYVGVCGTSFQYIGRNGFANHPLSHEEIFEQLLTVGCVIGHPTVIMRRKKLEELGARYDPDFPNAEDYALWASVSDRMRLANLPDVLLEYRVHSGQVSSVNSVIQDQNTMRIKSLLVLRLIGTHDPKDRELAEKIFSRRLEPTAKELSEIRRLLKRIIDRNRSKRIYDAVALEKFLGMQWLRLCFYGKRFRARKAFLYFQSPLSLRGFQLILENSGRFFTNFRIKLAGYRFGKLLIRAEKGIYVELTGSMGNQMFQYATALRVASKRAVPVKMDTWLTALFRHFRFRLQGFNLSGKLGGDLECLLARKGSGPAFLIHRSLDYRLPIHFRRIIHERFCEMTESLDRVGKRAYLRGDWHGEQYFESIRPRLLREFQPRQRFSPSAERQIAALRSGESVGIHIRKADYLIGTPSDPEHWPASCPPQYYLSARELLKSRVQSPEFYLFTSDAAWLGKTFEEQSSVGPIIEIDEEDPESLAVLSSCRHQILANSDFSWWAGWLNQNAQKVVIAPQHWFPTSDRSVDRFIPGSWEKI